MSMSVLYVHWAEIMSHASGTSSIVYRFTVFHFAQSVWDLGCKWKRNWSWLTNELWGYGPVLSALCRRVWPVLATLRRVKHHDETLKRGISFVNAVLPPYSTVDRLNRMS